MDMFKEFRKFVLRGNVVDLAVGIAIGAAFTSLVNSLVKGFIDPLVAVFYGGQKLASSSFTINGKEFLYGDIINSVISFLIVALVIFFFVVQPINKLTTRFGSGKDEGEPMQKCPHCLSKIPKAATKCMFCTSNLEKTKA